MSPDDRRKVAEMLKAQLPPACRVNRQEQGGPYDGSTGGYIEVHTPGVRVRIAIGVRRIVVADRQAYWGDTRAMFTGPHTGRGWRDRLVADVVAAVVEDARQLATTQ